MGSGRRWRPVHDASRGARRGLVRLPNPSIGLGIELRGSSGLLWTSLKTLADGPRTTDELAAEVLSLRGNRRAATAAVYTLLGEEASVQVDAHGVWSLVEPEVGPGLEPLREQEWVVVDVETTGGAPGRGHRIIEFAAVHVGGGEIRGEYSTLVNPYRWIPGTVSSVTGIAGSMVADAPSFAEIAPRVVEALRGRVFVGHNARYDWAFVSTELDRCLGRRLSGRRLCTLRIAHRLYPNLYSRSLGALAEHFGIPMEVHHRALEDAAATARLLILLLGCLEEEGVVDWAGLDQFIRRRKKGRRRRTARPVSMDRA
ncbi:MAG: hypothetical protein GEU90_04205 [Gemmatimonas sp.]|nr:hypothetical protein [Gemmatimonas sp.]